MQIVNVVGFCRRPGSQVMKNISISLGQILLAASRHSGVLWVVQPGGTPVQAACLMITSLPVSEGDRQKIAEFAQTSSQIDIELAESCLLVKNLEIPVAARAHFENVVNLRLQQSLPEGGKGLVWRSRLCRSGGGALDVRTFILKQAHLSDLQAAVQASGRSLGEVRLAGNAAIAPFFSPMTGLRRATRNWALAMFLLVLAAIALELRGDLGQLRNLQEVRDTVASRTAALRDEVVAARESAETFEKQALELEEDVARFSRGTGRVSLLAALTESFPDEAWISELSLSGDQLRLAGFSRGEVSNDMARLQELAAIRSVELDGPISFDSHTREHRFELLLLLEQPLTVAP